MKSDRDTDFQNLAHYWSAGLKVILFQNNTFSFQNNGQRNRYADCLRKCCAKSSTSSPQVQDTHKQIIQTDVSCTGNGDKVHRTFAVTHTTENRTDNVIRCDKGDTDKANGQVCHSPVHGFCRSGHCRSDGMHQCQQSRHQRDRHRHKKHHSITNILCRLFTITRTAGLPDADGRSHCKSDDHHREHMHNL